MTTKKFRIMVKQEERKEGAEHPKLPKRWVYQVALDHVKKKLRQKRDRNGRYT